MKKSKDKMNSYWDDLIKQSAEILSVEGNCLASDVLLKSNYSIKMKTFSFAEYGINFVSVWFTVPADLYQRIESTLEETKKKILKTLLSVHTDGGVVKIDSVFLKSEEL